MTQRYKPSYNFGVEMSNNGAYVLLTDAEADKAAAVEKAVEKATTEMRAELVALLELDARSYEHSRSAAAWMCRLHVDDSWPPAARLVELKAWERLWSGTRYHYRPIEP